MRKLVAEDLYKVGAMLRKVAPQVADLTKQSKDGDKSELGMKVFGLLLDKCYDDAWAWLAGLDNMSVDEFNAQPISRPSELIDELLASEDFSGFLSRLRGLVNTS
jgi:hypothetical protein